ncbi:hypothetical protein H6P81_020198 [Aristolochia fimbriata]|uniref:E3 ubiquitin-protein ligase FANCL n=1 Tax=Aristolochia fimbriata TaxID=158543 RepID=A0AAV7DTW6_ARIFI|nr:hypothetical protein H6P81_020198 [Aristolochia fimbriata]
MAPSPAFFRFLYNEIEEVGWEHLVKLKEDLTSLSFRILALMDLIFRDKKGQPHMLEIELSQDYPKSAPCISADVPYICQLQWSMKSRLKDVVQQFRELLEQLQEFWSTKCEIDRNLAVVDQKQLLRATSCCQINLGNNSYMMISVNPRSPKSLPECRFFGPDSEVHSLLKRWRRNQSEWADDKSICENLAKMLEMDLPGPSYGSKDEQVDCGICYAIYLPVDPELGVTSGSAPDYTCDNPNCRKAFHSLCLRDWLCSITTTKQSFDVLFGTCPYCSEPIAVKVDSSHGTTK